MLCAGARTLWAKPRTLLHPQAPAHLQALMHPPGELEGAGAAEAELGREGAPPGAGSAAGGVVYPGSVGPRWGAVRPVAALAALGATAAAAAATEGWGWGCMRWRAPCRAGSRLAPRPAAL